MKRKSGVKTFFLVTIKLNCVYEGVSFLIAGKKLFKKFKLPDRWRALRNGSDGPYFSMRLATREDFKKHLEIQNKEEDFQQFLMDLHQDPMKIFIKEHNTLEDILTPSEIEIYNHQPPSGTWVLEQALKKKLEEDPDYEVWVPLRHWSLHNYNNNKKLCFTNGNFLISNKGRGVDLDISLIKKVGSVDTKGYLRTSTKSNKGERRYFSLHRAVGCNFITPKGNNATKPLTTLTINHKNGIKTDNDFLNLEWVTAKENAEHAITNGFFYNDINHPGSKPLLGTVLIPGEFFNTKFIIVGEKERKLFGLGSAIQVAKNELRGTRGCIFTHATPRDILKYERIANLPSSLHLLIKDQHGMHGISTPLGSVFLTG